MLKKFLLTAAMAVGALCVSATPASAQWGRHGNHGSHHGSHKSHYGSHGSYGHGYGGHSSYRGYYSGGYGHHVRQPVWHDTTHTDYHGPSIQRHGFHLHIVPGHYDVHRSGHYDH